MDQCSTTEESSMLHMEEKHSLFYPLRAFSVADLVCSIHPTVFPTIFNNDYYTRVLIIDVLKDPDLEINPSVRYFRQSALLERKEEAIWDKLGVQKFNEGVVTKRLITPPDAYCDRVVICYREIADALKARGKYNQRSDYPDVCAILASELISKIEKWEEEVVSTTRVSKQTQFLYFALQYAPSSYKELATYVVDLLCYANVTRYKLHLARQLYYTDTIREVFIEFDLLSDALKLEIYADSQNMYNGEEITARVLRNPVLLQHDLRVRKKVASKSRDMVCEARNAADDGYTLPQVGCCYIKCRGCGNRFLDASSLYAEENPELEPSSQYPPEEI